MKILKIIGIALAYCMLIFLGLAGTEIGGGPLVTFIMIIGVLVVSYKVYNNEIFERELKNNNLKSYKDLLEKIDNLKKEKEEISTNLANYKLEVKETVKEEFKDEIEKYNEDLIIRKQNLEKDLEKVQLEFNELNGFSHGIVPTEFEFERSETYKERLANIKFKEKEMLSKIDVNSNDTVEIKVNNLRKLTYYAFNTFCDFNLSKLTFKNYPTRVKAIETNYARAIRLSENKIEIPEKYKDLKLEELESSYAYYKKLEEEKDALREEREQEKENKRAQKELEAKQAKLDKEIEALNIAKEKVESKLSTAKDDEIESLKAELNRLREQIANFEDEKSDIDYRIENTGAGYVYVISNIGSFGESVYKIGVTRRLDPYQRIAELSSASVPFKFDVHAMIFSYQAYQLETELHNYFDKKRVNKVNNRKEFFNITINEIKKVLNLHKELTFDFVETPDADEYRQSILMEA